MERLVARLVCDDIANIALFAEPSVVGLYEKLGFIKDPRASRAWPFRASCPVWHRSPSSEMTTALSRER